MFKQPNNHTFLCNAVQMKGSSSNNNTQFTQDQFTQPSSNFNYALQSQRTRTGMQYNGQNLINRFDFVNFNQPSLNPSYNKIDWIQIKKIQTLGIQRHKVKVKLVATTMATPEIVTPLYKQKVAFLFLLFYYDFFGI